MGLRNVGKGTLPVTFFLRVSAPVGGLREPWSTRLALSRLGKRCVLAPEAGTAGNGCRQTALSATASGGSRRSTLHSTSRPRRLAHHPTPPLPAVQQIVGRNVVLAVSPSCCGLCPSPNDVRLHPEMPLVPLLSLVISGSRSPVRFLVDDGASMAGVTMVPSRLQPCDSRWALISSSRTPQAVPFQ